MCLAIPAKIIRTSGSQALADMSGVRRPVDVRFLENVKKGDYVLVHAGFAIEKIDPKEARETLKLLKSVSFE
ncbi:MAG TPA: HypC/HybG/HupF family hydrogenase formation chaperone [Candidatus Omnitrophota bacterium]|nr:HypC/HybG/HupF family hydrogenase formation chaperone [Candidatus Omnitrophota bacterium]